MPMIQDFLVLLVAALSVSNVAASPINNQLPPWPSTPTPATITPAPTSVGNTAIHPATTPAPGTDCTTNLFAGHKFGALNQATCTYYDSYTTVTEYVDCGGCSLKMQAMGAGPVVQCSTDTTLPLGTTTVTTCSINSSSKYPESVTAPSTPTPTPSTLPDYEPPQ